MAVLYPLASKRSSDKVWQSVLMIAPATMLALALFAQIPPPAASDVEIGRGLFEGKGQCLSCHRIGDNGKGTSLLKLTESVATMLDVAAKSGGIPKMESCAEPVALLVTTLQAP